MILNSYKAYFRFLALILTGYFLASCGITSLAKRSLHSKRPKDAKSFGTPYRVKDKTYYPLKTVGHFTQEGVASWYGPKFHGKLTSNKEIYDMNAMTAAHKILPFDTQVRVVNLDNGRETVVRINDRGPFVNNRIIDLSYAAAHLLGMADIGTALIRLTVLNPTKRNITSHTIEPLRYSVQIGIFKEMANARSLEQSISESRTETVVKKGSPFYRVLVGDFDQYEKALKKIDALRFQGYPNAFIVAP